MCHVLRHTNFEDIPLLHHKVSQREKNTFKIVDKSCPSSLEKGDF